MVDHPARRDDDGFTLIELIITMVIVGIVMSAVVGALFVMLRTQAGTTARLDETRGTQQLTTYFATDVQSTGYGSDTITPTTASVCTVSSPTPNANAVQMTWTEVIPNGPTSTYYVSYRYEPLGSDWLLVRYSCKSGALTPNRIVVARALATPPVGWTGTSTPTAVAATSTSTSITLRMTTKSGYQYSVTGTRLTPPAAPTGCTTSPTVNPSSVTFPGASPAALPQTVAVSAPLVGNCTGTVNLSVFTGISTVTTTMSSTNPAVANLSGGSWTSGSKLIELSIGGTPIGTATLNIVGCELSVVATPNSQTLAGTVLSTAITVTATPAVSARCTSPMTLLYTATASGTETAQTMSGPSAGPWTTTIPVGTTFDDGPAQLSVRQTGADTTLYSTIVQLAPGSPACILTSPSVSPSTIALQTGNVLPAGVTVNATSNGYCGTPMVRYTAGSTTYTVAMTGGSSPSFSYTLPTTQVWSAGTATFTFKDSGGTNPVTATLTVNPYVPPCTMSPPTVSSSSIQLQPGNTLPSSISVTVATNGACGTPKVNYTAGSTAYSVSMSLVAGSTYSYTLPTTQTWPAGPATFTFVDSTGATPSNGVKTATTTLLAPCSVTSVVFTPSPIGLNGSGDKVNPDADIRVTVNSTAACAGISLVFQPSAPPPTGWLSNLVPTPAGSPTVFGDSIPKNTGWIAGAKAFDIKLGSYILFSGSVGVS
jgi:prepilin-type N-terminal cleavage/methylation domain-containing protein